MKKLQYACLAAGLMHVVWFGIGQAQERGIGVSPANFEIPESVSWPYTIPLFVTNLSSEKELFEITFDKNQQGNISANSGRFTLGSEETGRVLLTFDDPKREISGIVLVSATRVSPEGLTTGKGIEVPFRIGGSAAIPKKNQVQKNSLLASVYEIFGKKEMSGQIIGALAILFSILLLWRIASLITNMRRIDSNG